jgi:hypothetical protein
MQRRADWHVDSERRRQTLSEAEVEELLEEWKWHRAKLSVSASQWAQDDGNDIGVGSSSRQLKDHGCCYNYNYSHRMPMKQQQQQQFQSTTNQRPAPYSTLPP